MHIAGDACGDATDRCSSASAIRPDSAAAHQGHQRHCCEGCRTTLVDRDRNVHGVTVKLRTIELAGSKVELPGCEAVTRTVPAPVSISLFFEIVAGPVTS